MLAVKHDDSDKLTLMSAGFARHAAETLHPERVQSGD